MYIQINEKAPIEQQIKQLKTQLEIILDNLELESTATPAGDSLPEGGADGQVLTKQADGNADWEDPTGGAATNGLPSGGTTNQLLAKNSNDNYDGKWVNPYIHPASHSPSIILEDENNSFITETERTAWNAKQSALGFTPEDSTNKKTSLAENSDTYYLTQKAVKTALDGKSDTGHGHAISDVAELSTTLNGKANTSDIPSIATQAEAEAGTNNTKMITPLRAAQAIKIFARPKDRIYVPNGSDLGYDDEFDDGSLSNTWTAVETPSYANTYYEPSGLKGLHLYVPSGKGGMKLNGILKSVGTMTPPYYIETAVKGYSKTQAYPSAGLVFATGATYGAGSQILAMPVINNRSVINALMTNFNARSSFSETTWLANAQLAWFYLRFVYESANTFRLMTSCDGVVWVDIKGTLSYTIAPTHFGIMETTFDNSTEPLDCAFGYFRVRSGLSANG